MSKYLVGAIAAFSLILPSGTCGAQDEAALLQELLEKLDAAIEQRDQLARAVENLSVRVDSLETPLPEEMIIASTKPCSALGAKWQDFIKANGRFILGANENRMHGLQHRAGGSDGGEEWIVIGKLNLPPFTLQGRSTITSGKVWFGEVDCCGGLESAAIVSGPHSKLEEWELDMPSHEHQVSV